MGVILQNYSLLYNYTGIIFLMKNTPIYPKSLLHISLARFFMGVRR